MTDLEALQTGSIEPLSTIRKANKKCDAQRENKGGDKKYNQHSLPLS
jgi:hypothetical protein